MTLDALESFGDALRVIDDVWALVQASPGLPSDKSDLLRRPDIGAAAITKRAADGRDLLDRIAGIAVDTLSYNLPCTAELAQQIADGSAKCVLVQRPPRSRWGLTRFRNTGYPRPLRNTAAFERHSETVGDRMVIGVRSCDQNRDRRAGNPASLPALVRAMAPLRRAGTVK